MAKQNKQQKNTQKQTCKNPNKKKQNKEKKTYELNDKYNTFPVGSGMSTKDT